jgi:purine nucleosidase
MALLSPEIQIEGITTVFGNARVDYCTRNVLYVLELLNRTDIPVRQGAARPLLGDVVLAKSVGRDREWNEAEQLQDGGQMPGESLPTSLSPHGEKGLGDFEIPDLKTTVAEGNAIQWLVETVMASPGEIEVLALGPLTNVALASLMEPAWAEAVKRVIFMGGALTVPGNVGPLSTANITLDAEAAKIAFHAGHPITMVGQDVTRLARLTPQHKEIMRKANTKVTRFLEDVTSYYADYYTQREPSLQDQGHPIHDMLVVAYLLQPALFRTEELYVTVETEGEVTRGQTVADWREFSPYEPQMNVCMEADNEALFDLYLDRITRDPGDE